MAVNGLAVGLATVGGFLLWSGIRNVTLADSIRETLNLPNQLRPIGPAFGDTPSGLGTYTPSGDTAAGEQKAAAAGDASSTELVRLVRSQIGKPYKWAAVGPNSFDCSGLVYWALKQSGFPKAPRFTTATFGTWAKANGWTRINSAAQFQAGDVVLKAGHMGVCSGPGRMIDAPHTGAFVREENLWKPLTQWWGWRMGRTILTAPTGGTAAQEQAELRRIG